MQAKHITLDNKATTVALEPIFWRLIDNLSDSPGSWIAECCRDKPAAVTRASWIRQRAVIGMLSNSDSSLMISDKKG